MKKIDSKVWEETKVSEGGRLPAGGYVAKIMNVEDRTDKQYLYIEFDIAEGDYIGYYDDLEKRAGFWGGKMYRSYKDSALGMFKGFIRSVEESNKDFVWEWDEKKLVGKNVGVILGEEEYIGNDGSVKTRLKVNSTKSVQDIKDGKFRVPQLKKLPEEKPSAANSFDEVETDIPF